MEVTSVTTATPFRTKDGSTIRELQHTTAQSVAEARLSAGQATQRHYHRASEEVYFLLEGEGDMEVDGETRRVRAGDAILIPPGAWHGLAAASQLRFLCCCAPPYSHDDTFFA